MARIAIIDYGSGNLRSVYNAVKRCEQIIKNIIREEVVKVIKSYFTLLLYNNNNKHMME